MSVIGLFEDNWDEDYREKLYDFSHPYRVYRSAIQFKANPRKPDYMKKLFKEHFPDGEFLNIDECDNWKQKLQNADRIVLLFPDATGLRSGTIRTAVTQSQPCDETPVVLNGRKRLFQLNTETKRKLMVRRYLEKGMVFEFCALMVFVTVTPFITLYDWMRGRF